jgi:hydroxypyruvate isomerase
MLRFCANLTTLFREYPFYERFEQASGLGFAAVEFMSPFNFDINKLKVTVGHVGLQVIQFNFLDGDLSAGERGHARKTIPLA